MTWIGDVQRHFSERPRLSPAQLHEDFQLPSDMSVNDVANALNIFPEAYGVPVGSLRGSDSLDIFTRAPIVTNPLFWIFRRFQYEDRLGDLSEHLGQGRKRFSVEKLRDWPHTLREFVLAWTGKEPPYR